MLSSSLLSMCACAVAIGFNMTVLGPLAPFYVRDLGMADDPRKPGQYVGASVLMTCAGLAAASCEQLRNSTNRCSELAAV
jgi:hypothetical protein